MLKLIIEDDQGRKSVVRFARDEVTIGRQEGNTVQLTERNVSRRHARLLRADGGAIVEDLGSYNGIRVNGERVMGQAHVREGDLIQIGDYDLALEEDGAAARDDADRSLAEVAEASDPHAITRELPVAPPDPAPKSASGSRALGYGVAALALLALVAVGAVAFQEAPLAEGAPTAAAPAAAAAQPLAAEPVPPAPVEDPAVAARAAIDSARAAMAALELDRAVGLLEEVAAAAGTPEEPRAEASDLLEVARAERLLGERVTEAATALQDRRFEEAAELLASSESTELFRDRHEALQAELAQSVSQEARKTRRPPVARRSSDRMALRAKRLHAEGIALFQQKKEFEKARAVFAKCLEVDPTFARCHLMLGSTSARLGDMESGARHYEQFVRLDPGAPEAPKVREMLEQYRNAQQSGGK